ncbi:MAG TPA: hypothetical protein VKB34_03210, partial [Povalibacter sp.]|nr:hypothetical protein [Povalibacter sp.]
FHLSDPAQVSLEIYDGRDLLIRSVTSKGTLPAGENRLSWDVRDQAGRIVPAEAYTYAFQGRTSDGREVRYDLADATGGQAVAAREVKWDAQARLLSYVIEKPARVSVRFGLQDGGPLLRTLIDWVVRPGGLQREAWDGKDSSGVLDLASHPRLAIGVQAFSLPENSLIVGDPQTRVNLIESLPGARQSRPHSTAARHMYDHAQQPLESRGDFTISLILPTDLRRSGDRLPIVSSTIPVRLDIAAADRARAIARRFEPVFFIDGQFAFENEVGFMPLTWNFDPAALNDGEHFLTVNLRGYEGNFGMATVKVLVAKSGTTREKR